jgi:hypothetical protein
MSDFTFSREQVESSIGLIDVEFDVTYETSREDWGKCVDWDTDGPITINFWTEEGEMEETILTDIENPLFQEVLKLVETDVYDACLEDSSVW